MLSNNKLRALVTAELIFDDLLVFNNKIEFEFTGYGVTHTMLSPREFMDKCRDVDILITEFDTINEDVLNSAKNLKLIICCRGGVSTVVDIGAATKRGILVCNNPGRNKIATAEFTIALILDLWRNISITNQLIHEDILQRHATKMPIEYGDSLWGLDEKSPYVVYRGDSYNKLTLGIIGYGNVGKLVAQKAIMLGMHVLIADYPSLDKASMVGVDVLEQDELLKKADVVTIHASKSKNNSPLIGEHELKLMKNSAYLINTSRGFLVDEKALISALQSGNIKGAALDVAQQEPLPINSELLTVPNLILTPHIAGSTRDTLRTGTQMAIDALKDYLCGIKPPHSIN